jgi:uncharacterized repeat protein (TIGR01451 family)
VLTWTGDLPAGAIVTVSQSFTVNNPATGNRTMSAVATSTGLGSSCAPGNLAPPCTATATVQQPELTVTSHSAPNAVTPGGRVTVSITATNTGPVTYTASAAPLGVTLVESMAEALDDATYNGDAAATGIAGQLSAPVGGELTWTPIGDMGPGESVTITYSVTANAPVTGDRSISRRVTATAVGANCQAGSTAQVCSSTVPVLIPELTITKTAGAASAAPGQTVGYTLTIANTGQADYPLGTTVTDDLTDVVDDATYLDDAAADAGSVGYAAPLLTWTGALAVGATATVTYSVRVEYRAGQQALTNAVTSTASGANCAPGNTDTGCASTVAVLQPAMTITKTADSPTVVVGGTVRYSIVLSNTGDAPYTAASVVDSLTDVLDAADYQGNASATSGAVGYDEPRLIWTGDLAVDATVVITYSALATGGGDSVLDNQVTSTEYGTTCPPAPRSPACATTTVVEAATITLSSLTGSVSLGGPAMTTAQLDGAITATVTTNSPTGYTVGVTAETAEMVPVAVGNPDRIPVSELLVRRTGDLTFLPLSAVTPVLVQIKPGPSQPGGDPLSTDLQIDVPLVRPDAYTVTLDYIAVTQ